MLKDCRMTITRNITSACMDLAGKK